MACGSGREDRDVDRWTRSKELISPASEASSSASQLSFGSIVGVGRGLE